NVSGEYPPTMLVHGTEDTDVPYELSAAMAKELARQKVEHELVTVKGAGHGLVGGDKKLVDEANEKALAFIRLHLKPQTKPQETDKRLAPFFRPPPEFADDLGSYRSPLKFADGSPVKSMEDWTKRRKEILKDWHEIMGPWPALIEKPKVEYLEKERRDD